MIESFWARMQTELLDRQRWNTRIELANAIFEYLEIFYNRRRRHSALDWLTPMEYEKLHTTNAARLAHAEVTDRGPHHPERSTTLFPVMR